VLTLFRSFRWVKEIYGQRHPDVFSNNIKKEGLNGSNKKLFLFVIA